VSGVVGDNRENLKESIQNLKAASARLDNTLDAAGKVMAKIDRGDGTLGKLVNDNTAHTSLTETLDGVSRYVRKYDALHMTLVPWVEYQTGTSDWKSYLNLKIQPTADKYYLLGVVNDPRGTRTETDTFVSVGGNPPVETKEVKFENKWKFNALMAKRFSRVTVRGGIMESTGGFGLEYDVVKDRFSVGADIFDFDRPDNNRPHLKLYGNYDIVKSLFITGGADDSLNRDSQFRTFFLGFGIKFPDDDLKTVIGAIPIKP
jgi:phospholipid/cholesterol/gamma-HCH transport system substrate-binding protein